MAPDTLAVQPSHSQGLSTGSAIPDVKAPDPLLLSPWATLATVFALAVLWRVVHNFFQLGVLARSPKLGHLKLTDGRSPRVLAAHFTSVANVAVCLAAYALAARERLAADGWSPGALFPLWSRPLAVGPPLPGTITFYLSLAAYCLHASLLTAERVACGVSSERMVLLQRALLFLLALSVCMVECVPELALAFFLLEVPSPFLALWQALQDFRLRTDPLYGVTSFITVAAIAKCRLLIFGFCLGCAISHPETREKLSGNGQRFFTITLCMALIVAYGVHFGRLCRDMNRDMQAGKDSREALRPSI